MCSFHFHRWNQFKLIPLASTLCTKNVLPNSSDIGCRWCVATIDTFVITRATWATHRTLHSLMEVVPWYRLSTVGQWAMCRVRQSGTLCLMTFVHSRTMCPSNGAWKLGCSLVTSVHSVVSSWYGYAMEWDWQSEDHGFHSWSRLGCMFTSVCLVTKQFNLVPSYLVMLCSWEGNSISGYALQTSLV